MSNFWQRALTGLVFVVVVLGGVLWCKESFIALIVLISSLCLFEFLRLFKDRENSVNPYFGAMAGAVLLLAEAIFWGKFSPISFLFILPLCLVLYNLFTLKKDVFSSAGLLAMGLLYFVLPFVYLFTHSFSFSCTGTYRSEPFLFLLVLVWSNDTFAYLGGKLLGRTKLMPKISPNKTVEGFVSGLLFASLASYLMTEYAFTGKSSAWYMHLLFGVVFGTAATVGDLIQSSVKRMAGVKDSGKILPGHGGAWDRFDGLIAVVHVYVFGWQFVRMFL